MIQSAKRETIQNKTKKSKEFEGYISLAYMSANLWNSAIRTHAKKLNIESTRLDVGTPKRKPQYFKIEEAIEIAHSICNSFSKYEPTRKGYVLEYIEELKKML